jgi:hypothetical protein
MSLTKRKAVAAATLATLIAIGPGVLARQTPEERPQDVPPGPERAPVSVKAQPAPERGESPSPAGRGGSEKVPNKGEGAGRSEQDKDRHEPGKSPAGAIPGSGPPREAEGYQPGGVDARSRAIIAKLDAPVSMPFENETPLEDVVKYVRQATTSPNDNGIPIYVDPIGLAEGDQTLLSPITIALEGVPLRTSLRLALRQLGLAYAVEDGVLIISTPGALDEMLMAGPIHQGSREDVGLGGKGGQAGMAGTGEGPAGGGGFR